MATLMTTADLEIAYAPTPSGFDYRVSLDGLWVASATTFHAADLVADEVQYRMFLANDPPGDDPAPETGLGSSSDEGDDPDA